MWSQFSLCPHVYDTCLYTYLMAWFVIVYRPTAVWYMFIHIPNGLVRISLSAHMCMIHAYTHNPGFVHMCVIHAYAHPNLDRCSLSAHMCMIHTYTYTHAGLDRYVQFICFRGSKRCECECCVYCQQKCSLGKSKGQSVHFHIFIEF